MMKVLVNYLKITAFLIKSFQQKFRQLNQKLNVFAVQFVLQDDAGQLRNMIIPCILDSLKFYQ